MPAGSFSNQQERAEQVKGHGDVALGHRETDQFSSWRRRSCALRIPAMKTELPSSVLVGDLVAERPGRARLFERLGIDYCCGGRRTLADACYERGLDSETVAVLLDASNSDSGCLIGSDWGSVSTAELCHHILDVHHDYLRRELPRLSELLEKCERAHALERPELYETRATFERLRVELEQHLDEEERTLFPACRRIAAGKSLEPGLLESMEGFAAEHSGTGAALRRLSALTAGYDTDTALCNTHRAAIDALAELERDLHEHIHEENNILFPRVLALARP
jgi:regulator of cell morphogenesis and NO signaling